MELSCSFICFRFCDSRQKSDHCCPAWSAVAHTHTSGRAHMTAGLKTLSHTRLSPSLISQFELFSCRVEATTTAGSIRRSWICSFLWVADDVCTSRSSFSNRCLSSSWIRWLLCSLMWQIQQSCSRATRTQFGWWQFVSQNVLTEVENAFCFMSFWEIYINQCVCPQHTKFDTALYWAFNKTHANCEADKMNGWWDVRATDRQSFVELKDNSLFLLYTFEYTLFKVTVHCLWQECSSPGHSFLHLRYI